MPLPFILGAGAAFAAMLGIKNGLEGAEKAVEANETIKNAEKRHNKNIKKFEEANLKTSKKMDELGELELNILNSFNEFSDVIEKIQNRPQFKEYNKQGVILPKYDIEELKHVSVGADVLLGSLSGAALGTAGGFAAAGATTSAVVALGKASTGTAILALQGVARTNATLAALGGGALNSSVLAGGVALGSTVLGVATLGVGLLVGGAIFNVTGMSLAKQADEAYSQMKRAEKTINKACTYLLELETISYKYYVSLKKVQDMYEKNFNELCYIVNKLNKTDWNQFNERERIITQNIVLLVGLLYKMCQVHLVKKSNDETDINEVNTLDINKSISDATYLMDDILANELENTVQTSDKMNGVYYYNIGNEYYEGIKGEVNYSKAFEFFIKASEYANEDAMCKIGDMFFEGKGVKQDFKKAYEWFIKSAKNNNALAMAHIAYLYRNGKGVEKDEVKAFEWAYMSALRGNEIGMASIAQSYLMGNGVEKDEVKAFEWYLQAAYKDFAIAMCMVGIMYAGGNGVEKDENKAKKWLRRSAEYGCKDAIETLKDLYKEDFVLQEKEFNMKLLASTSFSSNTILSENDFIIDTGKEKWNFITYAKGENAWYEFCETDITYKTIRGININYTYTEVYNVLKNLNPNINKQYDYSKDVLYIWSHREKKDQETGVLKKCTKTLQLVLRTASNYKYSITFYFDNIDKLRLVGYIKTR